MSDMKIGIVYPFLPHYRAGVFRELDNSSRYHYTFYADNVGRSGIAVVESSLLKRIVRTPTFQWKTFLWQSNLLASMLKTNDKCVIFLGDAKYITTWIAALILRLKRRRVLFWTIGWHRPERGLKRLMRLAFYLLADHLLLYGDTAKSIGVRAGYPPSRMTVIYNSNDGDSSHNHPYVNLKEGRLAGKRHVGAVIRLNTVKRLDMLVQAVSLIPDNECNLRVVLVGDGPEKAHLQRIARELDVDLVILPATYNANSLSELYEYLDLTVVPELSGLTTIQSMLHGVPVVSSDDPYAQVPEWEAIVEGRTGWLYQSGDVEDLARVIEGALDSLSNDVVRAEYSLACKGEVESKWASKVHAETIERALDRILGA